MFHKEWVVSAFSQKVTYFLYKPLKNRSKYKRDILEKSAVCTESMSGIGLEVFRKNVPISYSYTIPYKHLVSLYIPARLKLSHTDSLLNKWRSR